MSYKNKFIVTMLAAAVLCLSAHADMIVNGSFETAEINTTWYTTLGVSNTQITGWKVITGSVDYIGEGLWKASDGVYSLDMNGRSIGGIEQSISTEIGKTYKVTFDMAGNPDSPYDKTLDLKAIGESTQTQGFLFDPPAGQTYNNLGWTTETWTFIADSNITKLQFISTTTSNVSIGAALDNVRMEAVGSVNPVPVPGAFLLGMIGMGIAGIRTRRTKS